MLTWFGSQTVGGSYYSIEDYLGGGLFNCPSYGKTVSVTALLSNVTAAKNMKCALYDSDSNYLGQTEERSIPTETNTWETFIFPSSLLLEPSHDYYIIIWSQATTGTAMLMAMDSAGTDNVYRQFNSYGVPPMFPDPASFSVVSNKTACIYCAYEDGFFISPTDGDIIDGVLLEHPGTVIFKNTRETERTLFGDNTSVVTDIGEGDKGISITSRLLDEDDITDLEALIGDEVTVTGMKDTNLDGDYFFEDFRCRYEGVDYPNYSIDLMKSE
jgi:hypothetical protein